MRTVGVINRHEDRKVVEIAEPFGVVAAIIPCTNPTSTAIYKVLISIKARCAIVLSPHPAAVGCITATAEVLERAGRAAGLPDGALGWMTTVTLEGTQELMRQRETAVILATGGMGLVRAAYGVGKPAYGVGPGERACLHRAHRRRAQGRQRHRHRARPSTTASCVRRRTRSSWTPTVADAARAEFRRQGAHFLTPDAGGRARNAARHPSAPAEPATRRQERHVHRGTGRHSGSRRARGC